MDIKYVSGSINIIFIILDYLLFWKNLVMLIGTDSDNMETIGV
jgi:hypothetical protein